MVREASSDENGAFCSVTGDFVFDDYQCTEAANVRILETGKVNDNQMADKLLSLPPLGLKLTFSSLLSDKKQQSKTTVESHFPSKFEDYSSQPASEKLKAAKFEAISIKIGKWERKKKNEGDITAKCYFAKKKLVWEFLQGNLKSKIEIQWNEIIGIRADLQENKPGALEIELNKAPDFFEEIDPQPRKHTIWRVTSDFTEGAASTYRRHCVVFPPGILDKHYEKLLQCDQRLYGLSHKPFPSLANPCFEQNIHRYLSFSQDRSNFNCGFQFNFSSFPSPIMATCPLRPFNETTSPVSVMDFSPSDEHITSNINVFDHSRMSSIPHGVSPTTPFLPALLSYQNYSSFSGQGTHQQDPYMVNYMLTNLADHLFSENKEATYGEHDLISNGHTFSEQHTFFEHGMNHSILFGELATNNVAQQTFYGSENLEEVGIGGEVAILRQAPLIQQAWENLTDQSFSQDMNINNHWR